VIVEITLYLVLGVMIALVESLRRRQAPYDALFLFNTSYFLFFVIAPLHVIIGGGGFVRQAYVFDRFGSGGVEVGLWLVLSYVLVLVGYALLPRFESPLDLRNIKSGAWLGAGLSVLTLGLVGALLYSQAVGGIETALRQAAFIRQGTYEVQGTFLFAKHLVPLLIVGVLFFLVRRWDRVEASRYKEKALVLWLVAFFIAVVFVGLIVGGRRIVLFPMLVLFLVWSNKVGRGHVVSLAVLGLMGFLFLAIWDTISWGVRDFAFGEYISQRMGSAGVLYQMAFRPFADSYMHWVGMFNLDSPLWGFRDWLVWPAYIVPSGLYGGVEPPSVIGQTTMMLKGVPLDGTGGEPPGFHGYFYMSGGLLGVITGSIFFGIVMKGFHCLLLPKSKSAGAWLVYVWVVFGVIYFVRHGMVEFVLTERFHWWLGLAVLSVWGLALGVRSRRDGVGEVGEVS